MGMHGEQKQTPVPRRDIDLLTLCALKQVIQHIAEAICDVVDDLRYGHIQ
jgi:hypothetical protein